MGKCFILILNHKYVMTWLCKSFPIKSKITCTIMDQYDFFGNDVFGGKFGFGRFGLFLSCFFFSFSMAWKRCGHKDLVGNQEGELHVSQIMVSFLFFFFLWQLCTLSRHCLVKWPFCIFLFFFLPIFDREFFLFLAFLQSLIEDFIFFFCFPPILDWGFSLFLLLFVFTLRW